MFVGIQFVMYCSYSIYTPHVSIRLQILEADEVATRYKKQCELGTKGTGIIKLLSDLMICSTIENEFYMKCN